MFKKLVDGTIVEYDLARVNELLSDGWRLYQFVLSPVSVFTASKREMRSVKVLFRLTKSEMTPSIESWNELIGKSLFTEFSEPQNVGVGVRSIRLTTDKNVMDNLLKRGFLFLAQGTRTTPYFDIEQFYILAEVYS